MLVIISERENTKKSDVRWMKTVLTSGTLADKVAALTVLIQESPLHNLSHIETMISMSRKKNRRENTHAVGKIEWFTDDHFNKYMLYFIMNLCEINWCDDDKKINMWTNTAGKFLNDLAFVYLKPKAHTCIFMSGYNHESPFVNYLVLLPDALKELFLTNIIPGNRKLKSFSQVLYKSTHYEHD